MKFQRFRLLNQVASYLGDCRQLIHELDDRGIDLCLTSPPYAEQRKADYPSVAEEDYTEFTLAWMEALRPKLSSNGSVLINIDPHVKDGVVADYVLKLQIALRETGWKQHRTQIWEKGGLPLARHDWPRHAYEQVLWFSLSNNPFCDPRAAGTLSKRIPVKDDKRFTMERSQGCRHNWHCSCL